MRNRGRLWRLAVACAIALAAATLGSPSAEARTETIRWTHEDPARVAGFRIFTRLASGSYGAPDFEGMPVPQAGVYSHAIEIADPETRFVVISAYDADGAESPFSNERELAGEPSPPDPPSESVLYQEDFESAGVEPDGWVDTSANNSMLTDDVLFSTAAIDGGRALTTASTLTNIHSHLVAAGSESWSGYEFQGRMRISQAGGGIGVTAYSAYPQADAYYRIRRYAGAGFQDFHVEPHPAGHTLSCASASSGVVPSPGEWIRFRIQVAPEAGATALRARVWPETGSEPSDWSIDCLDTRADRFTAGRVGVWSMGAGTKHWDDLQVVSLTPVEVPLGAPGRPQLVAE